MTTRNLEGRKNTRTAPNVSTDYTVIKLNKHGSRYRGFTDFFYDLLRKVCCVPNYGVYCVTVKNQPSGDIQKG